MRRLCFGVLLAAVLLLVADISTAALTVRQHESTNSTSLDSSERTRALATKAKSDPAKLAQREEEEEDDAVDGVSEERFGFIRSWITRATDKIKKLATYYKWIYSGKTPDDIKVFPGKTSHTGYYDFYFKRTHKHGDYVWN